MNNGAMGKFSSIEDKSVELKGIRVSDPDHIEGMANNIEGSLVDIFISVEHGSVALPQLLRNSDDDTYFIRITGISGQWQG